MTTSITRARERYVELVRVKGRISEFDADIQRLTRRAAELVQRVHSEARDVERLEGLSLQALFHAILGDRVEAVAKERRELLAVELERDAVRERLADAERQRDELHVRRDELADAPEELQRAVDAAHQAVLAGGGPRASEMKGLTERGDALREKRLQLQEAESAAERAVRVFADVDKSFASAQNWSTFDLMGGGFIATSMKHSRLDDARTHLGRARSAIATLERELGDVRSVVRPDEYRLPIEGGLTVADYLFDGLIVDWMVHKRIDESVARARSLKSRITLIGGDLRAERQRVEAELADVDARARALISNRDG